MNRFMWNGAEETMGRHKCNQTKKRDKGQVASDTRTNPVTRRLSHDTFKDRSSSF